MYFFSCLVVLWLAAATSSTSTSTLTSTAIVPISPQITASPIRTATAPLETPEPFMENGPPAAATSGQKYLRSNGNNLEATDAYVERHTALEQLGPLGEHSTTNQVQTPDGDLGRQDMLQWVYGSKENKQAPPPIQPAEDPLYKPDKIEPPMKPSTITETGAYFTDSSNIKIDNNHEALAPVTTEPADTESPPGASPLPDPVKGDEVDKSYGAFDTFGKEDDPATEDPLNKIEQPGFR